MIEAERFNRIRQNHGLHGSWAVWVSPSRRPKSEVGNLDILDERLNPTLLETLNPEVVMVGLNLGHGTDRPDRPFRNFHSPSPSAHDFKIRYAFSGTDFWGTYMTDIIKKVVEPVSGKLVAWLSHNPQVIADNVKTFRTELSDLGCHRPVILAFGGAAYDLLGTNLGEDDYSRLVRLTHYSHRISKEKYRDEIHQQLQSSMELPNKRLHPTAAGVTMRPSGRG